MRDRSTWRAGSLGSRAALLLIALAPRPALAQTPPAPAGAPVTPAPAPQPPATVVPPRPITPLRAEYPQGAHGNATVLLVITVNADGSIRTAKVVEGIEPFAAAAVSASASWRFSPATRGGKPVAASIRAKIEFTEPTPIEAEPEADSAATTTPAPGPSGAGTTRSTSAAPGPRADEPIEVLVRGERTPPGVTTLSRAEVRLMPGAFGDPFRAIETLPGVTPIISGLPFYYVRGAPPGNVGYFLDGIRVPLLYHLAFGPSVIHPGSIERVDLYPGGYPARFGRFAGAIVSGETRLPSTELHGEGNIRLFDAGAMVEAPFAGGRGAVFAGGRYSYTAALLSILQPQIGLDYWDYQGRVSFELTPRDKVTLFAFGSYDRLTNTDSNGLQDLFVETTFHRLDMRYEHRLGPESFVRQAITLGHDLSGTENAQAVGPVYMIDHTDLNDWVLSSRTEINHRISDRALVRVGLDAMLDRYSTNQNQRLGPLVPGFEDFEPPGGTGEQPEVPDDVGPDDDNDGDADEFLASFKPRYELTTGVYADLVLNVTPSFEVIPGVRIDFFGARGASALAVDPRLAARLTIVPGLHLVQAHGLASQMPSLPASIPGIAPPLTGGLQRSFQSSAGLEAELPGDITAKATVFRNAFFNMTDLLGSPTITFETLNGRSMGSSIGMEISAHRRLTRTLGGFLSYTLARSERMIGRYRAPAGFDRTHVANAAVVYDLGKGWRAGGRFVFYSGTPTRDQLEDLAAEGEGGGFDIPTKKPPDRLPPFARLDVRLEKRWQLAGTGWISFVVEMLNATLSTEPIRYDCSVMECELNTLGPISVPSLGVEGGF